MELSFRNKTTEQLFVVHVFSASKYLGLLIVATHRLINYLGCCYHYLILRILLTYLGATNLLLLLERLPSSG
jgi:hypothetical protein